jgi:hypothetical protein
MTGARECYCQHSILQMLLLLLLLLLPSPPLHRETSRR